MKVALGLGMVALCVALAGCWKSSETPQQKFAEALMHGNSMQASTVWLHMSPEDRLKFSRGEGLSTNPKTAKETKQQILNHYQRQMQGGEAATDQGAQVEIPTPLGASIQQLPAFSGQAPAQAQPANPQGQ